MSYLKDYFEKPKKTYLHQWRYEFNGNYFKNNFYTDPFKLRLIAFDGSWPG